MEVTYIRRGNTLEGEHTKETYTGREIYTERTCTRRNVHLKGYIHGGEIHMKEQPNKEIYT